MSFKGIWLDRKAGTEGRAGKEEARPTLLLACARSTSP